MEGQIKLNVPYFQAPNNIFEVGLKDYELLVYLYLCRCGNNGGRAFPSYQTIADKCGISRSTAVRAIKSLAENHHLIAKQKRPKANNDNETNVYIIMTPSVSQTPPSITQTPPPSVREELPSVSQTPNKEIPYKEIDIDKEIQKKENEPSSFFNSFLMLWNNNYRMKTGKEPEPITESLMGCIQDIIDKGMTEQTWREELKIYIKGHKQPDLQEFLNRFKPKSNETEEATP